MQLKKKKYRAVETLQVGSSDWLEAMVARLFAVDGTHGYYDAHEYENTRELLKGAIGGDDHISFRHDEIRF